MATDRRKILETARKYAQRGAREKALAQYETLLHLDPHDTRLRLEIGDVHRRWGRCEQAIAHYGRVAGQFRSEGFEARAVAVWKRILQLDSKRYEAYVALSDLYQHLGLQSQAVDALQEAIDGLYREGRTREALENLRRMGQLDPANTTSRQKVADLLVKEGMVGDATQEHKEIIAEFERVGDFDSIPVLYERLLELNPDRVSFRVALARSWLRIGRFADAESHTQAVLASDPENIEASEILLEVCRQLGRDSEAAEVSRRLAESYRERGDDDRASEITQRLPGGGAFELGHAGDLRLGSAGAEIDFGPDEIENVDLGDTPVVDEIKGPSLELDAGPDGPWPLEGAAGQRTVSKGSGDEETPPGLSDPPQWLGDKVEEPNGDHGGDETGSVFPDAQEVEIEISCELALSDPEEGIGGSEAVEVSDRASIDEELEEAKFYLDQSLYDEAEAILQRVLALVPGHPTALSHLDEMAALREEPREVVEGHQPDPELDDDSLDVGSLVREALDSTADSRSELRRQEVQSAVGDGMEEIFADFKRGVNEELSARDIETRFDLGIAYREMSLFEDARVEFEACLALEARRIDSLHMMALCARDLDRPADAVRYLEQALASKGLPEDRRDGLHFDLGLARESAGDPEGALVAYRQVENPAFPGLGPRLGALEAGAAAAEPAAEPDAEDFESFDDLIAEAEAMETRATFSRDPRPEASELDGLAGRRREAEDVARPPKKISFV